MHEHEHLRPELNRVEERLRAVEVQLGRLTAQLTTEQAALTRSLGELHKVCEAHARVLVGPNGHALTTRVAVLEESERARKWSLRAVWGAMIALGVKVLHDLIRGAR